MLTAWGDESGSSAQRDPGTYVLGAILIDDSDLDFARRHAQKLRLPAETKVHWYTSSDANREKISNVITSLPVRAIVVVRLSLESERVERRRRKGLEYLLSILTAEGCEKLVLESRGKKDDERDRDLADALRSQRRLGTALKLEHASGPNEPMLWLADALCGATVAERLGNPQWWNIIRKVGTIHTIDARL
jgi:hypothetical protein